MDEKTLVELERLGHVVGAADRAVYGPGMLQVNVALSRTFRLHERQSLQFRAEAFNLPNALNPNNPSTARNSAIFGVIQSDISGTASIIGTTGGDYRAVQVAAKYVF